MQVIRMLGLRVKIMKFPLFMSFLLESSSNMVFLRSISSETVEVQTHSFYRDEGLVIIRGKD
jgi:hypothetical protein